MEDVVMPVDASSSCHLCNEEEKKQDLLIYLAPGRLNALTVLRQETLRALDLQRVFIVF